MRNQYIDRFKLVIIDEIHMLGDSHRGATIEALVAKLKLLQTPPRIIGLSATINRDDAAIYGKWLGGFVYSCAERPSLIKQYVILPDGHQSRIINGEIKPSFRKVETISQDKNYFLPLIADAIKSNPHGSVLIFVNSRKETREYASLIAKFLYSDTFGAISKIPQPSNYLLEQRKSLISKIENTKFSNDQLMAKCLMKGVAFHNAGLLLEERKFIEDALRNGIINVIVATTTLSAGINITNVTTVIIKNVFRFDGEEQISLTGAQYNQMAGRAGRTALNSGNVIILQQKLDDKETNVIKELSRYNIGHIKGHLMEKSEFDRFYLQCLAFFQCNNASEFPSKLYEVFSRDIKQATLDLLRDDSKSRLIANRLIINENKVTKLGNAIAGANFGIEEGLEVYEIVKKAQYNVCLSDELHLLFLVIPEDIGFRTPPYSEHIWQSLFSNHHHVINEIIQLPDEELEKRITLSYIRGGIKNKDSVDKTLDKLYAASILLDVINEKSLAEIEDVYSVDRGTIQSLQTNVSTFAGQVVKFCELCSFQVLGAAINKFRKRLDYSVKNELLPLMSLPSCSQNMARIFFNQGIETPNDLALLGIAEIVPILITALNLPPPIPTSFTFHSRSNSQNSKQDVEKLASLLKSEAEKLVENQRKINEIGESMIQLGLNDLFTM